MHDMFGRRLELCANVLFVVSTSKGIHVNFGTVEEANENDVIVRILASNRKSWFDGQPSFDISTGETRWSTVDEFLIMIEKPSTILLLDDLDVQQIKREQWQTQLHNIRQKDPQGIIRRKKIHTPMGVPTQ